MAAFGGNAGRHPRDGSGMSALTKRHFDHVKQKLFAFVDRQQRIEVDGRHLAPQTPFHHNPQPQHFVDQRRQPKPQSYHHMPVPSHNHLQVTPVLPRKHFQASPVPAHKQLPHLALATPKLARRR